MARRKQKEQPSTIVLEEYFAAEDDRFVDHLTKIQTDKYLATFVQKWLAAASPWSRQQVIRYLDGSLNLPGHEVVVKRLYKHFLAANDHELLGVFLVTFDRMVRRTIGTSYHYDWSTRRSWTTEFLRARTNKTIHDITGRMAEYEYGGKKVQYPLSDLLNKPGNMLFSHRTRNYLRRSIWRHFRNLSFREPDTYVVTICKSIARFRDKDFETGINVVDNWSLMHACYFHSDVIRFNACHANVVDGKSLGNLAASPYQPDAWKSELAGDTLIQLLVDAQSTLVRIWAMEMLRSVHPEAGRTMKFSLLMKLLSSPDPNIQKFASDTFRNHPKLPTLTVDQWLVLLDESEPTLLSVICDSMKEHVSPERLDTEQLIKLTCAKQAPVASMGFELLQQRDASRPLSISELVGLADTQCAVLTTTTTSWAIQQICKRQKYDSELVIDFFDAMLRPTRTMSLKWLAEPNSPGFDDARLWAQLIESPFDDVKIELINLLEKRRHASQKNNTMLPVWVSVILDVHRGSRTKPKAIQQIRRQIESHPEQSTQLLPVLAVALRSIRPPEMRNALAAIVSLANHSSDLRTSIQQHFPEIEFQHQELLS